VKVEIAWHFTRRRIAVKGKNLFGWGGGTERGAVPKKGRQWPQTIAEEIDR
jgi:hypothetical protein